MIRIQTKLSNGKVFTVPVRTGWVTLVYYNNKCIQMTDAANLMDAGTNHLYGAQKVQELICRNSSPENECKPTSE